MEQLCVVCFLHEHLLHPQQKTVVGTLLNTSLRLLQLDKAAADVAQFKAGFDKAVADGAEHRAQVGFCAVG